MLGGAFWRGEGGKFGLKQEKLSVRPFKLRSSFYMSRGGDRRPQSAVWRVGVSWQKKTSHMVRRAHSSCAPNSIHILASTSAPFISTTVQMPNLALINTKRITVHWKLWKPLIYVRDGSKILYSTLWTLISWDYHFKQNVSEHCCLQKRGVKREEDRETGKGSREIAVGGG
jgi:hypothetical protein